VPVGSGLALINAAAATAVAAVSVAVPRLVRGHGIDGALRVRPSGNISLPRERTEY